MLALSRPKSRGERGVPTRPVRGPPFSGAGRRRRGRGPGRPRRGVGAALSAVLKGRGAVRGAEGRGAAPWGCRSAPPPPRGANRGWAVGRWGGSSAQAGAPRLPAAVAKGEFRAACLPRPTAPLPLWLYSRGKRQRQTEISWKRSREGGSVPSQPGMARREPATSEARGAEETF